MIKLNYFNCLKDDYVKNGFKDINYSSKVDGDSKYSFLYNRYVKFSNIFKNVTVWTLGIVLTIFTTVLSLESTITSSVDGLAGKATKAAVSGFIPVVGKIMGDSADTVLGSVNVLKNSVGIMGTIIIFVIAVMPSVKVACYWILFKALAALSEPCADENVVNLFEVISDNYKVLLGILFSITIMFVIGIAIVLKATNMSLMYR